jgi:tryptophan synthase alpha chain
MSRLDQTFAALAAGGRRGLVAFVVAGDPDLDRSARVLGALDRAGADVIEIGVPFSDPVADGVAIQRASDRAVRAGVTLRSTLDLVSLVRPRIAAPIVLFTYANPVYRVGANLFAGRAAEAGVDGVLVVDLPVEESADLGAALSIRGLDHVLLVSPTTSDDRIARAAEVGRGFVYAVSTLGVTGARERLENEAIARLVGRVRARTPLPVALGFGISRPDQVRQAVRHADAAVVGSALVRVVEQSAAEPDLEAKVEAHVRWLRSGLSAECAEADVPENVHGREEARSAEHGEQERSGHDGSRNRDDPAVVPRPGDEAGS